MYIRVKINYKLLLGAMGLERYQFKTTDITILVVKIAQEYVLCYFDIIKNIYLLAEFR